MVKKVSPRKAIQMWKSQVRACQEANGRLAETSRQLQEKVAAYDHAEGRIVAENARLSQLIEGLKEDLFNKSIALANAEGQLQRVDHEDAERAEVVQVEDYQLTKLQHHSGVEVAGAPLPFKRAMLKYELAKSPMRLAETASLAHNLYDRHSVPPKHWVNQR